jgi:hypothetical protein
MKAWWPAAMLVTLAASRLSAQMVETSTAERTTLLASARHDIEDARPDIPLGVLDADQVVVSKALDSVADTLVAKRNFSREQGRAAVLWTWSDLRTNKMWAEKTVGMVTIQQHALTLGRLLVKSDPDNAKITVDVSTWKKPTNTNGFAKQGTRRVRVEKPGFAPAEQECEMKEDAVTTFTATLGKDQSSAVCN